MKKLLLISVNITQKYFGIDDKHCQAKTLSNYENIFKDPAFFECDRKNII